MGIKQNMGWKMTVGTDWSLGSVSTEMHIILPDIPDRISGTAMYHTIMSAINYIENYTGMSIGSTAINAKYQDAILYRTAINVLNSQSLEGADVGNINLGEFSINKGASSNTEVAIGKYRELLQDELQLLGKKIKYYRTY